MIEFVSDGGLTHPEPAIVRGWAQCRKALTGPDLVSDVFRAGLAQAPTNNLLFMDGDTHQKVRQLVTSYLTAPHLRSVGKRLEERCDALIRSLRERPNVDLVTDLVEPLVLEGIMSVMEVPSTRRPILADLARGMLGLLEPDLPSNTRREAAKAALRATMLFERDGQAGNAAGLHGVLEAAAREGVIPIKLATTTPVVVLHGGYENPLNQLGCLIAWAVAHPERFREAVVSAPNLIFAEHQRR